MSLINQALRKAQRDRHPSRMNPGTADPSGPSGPSGSLSDNFPPTSNGLNLPLIGGLVFGIIILIGLVAGLTVVLFLKSPEPASGPQTTLASEPLLPLAESIPPQHTPPVSTDAALPGPGPQSQTASAPANAPQSLLEELQSARQAAEAKAAEDARAAWEAEAAAKAAQAAAEAKAAAQHDAAIIEWLSEARISGVRFSEGANKVIINNRTYEEGEIVSPQHQLKILIIEQTRVLFLDRNDKRYMKRL